MWKEPNELRAGYVYYHLNENMQKDGVECTEIWKEKSTENKRKASTLGINLSNEYENNYESVCLCV